MNQVVKNVPFGEGTIHSHIDTSSGDLVMDLMKRPYIMIGMAGLLPGEHLVPYLNRLADLVWVLARAAEQAESTSSTPSRTDGRR